MQSSRYPTDLSDDQWRCIRPHLCPAPQDKDAPGFTAYGPILDAVFFYVLLRAALPFWRLLPRDYFPPWKTLYDWFRKWRIDGTFERLNAELRERLRVRLLGTNPQQPSSAGIVDSQSAKTTGVGGNERGLDPAKKKVKGTKRHLLVWDTEGLVLKVRLHSAKVPDQKTATAGCYWARCAITLRAFSHLLWVDAG